MLLWALLASILLHLLIGLTMALLPDLGQNRTAEEPIFVEVLPPRKTPPPRLRELEAPRNPPVVQRREQPARRLGPDDRIAPRETAQEGHDTEDRQPAARVPQSASRPAAPASPSTPPTVATTPSTATGEAPPRPVSPQGEFSPAPAANSGRPQPSLKDLMTLAPATRERMESDWRRKAREGVERGDTVWLDTEHDLLISFFKRFRDNIYNVWNYPERARLHEEQGTCLLRIVVSREGTIDDVQLLESSGFRDLDEEAIRAVKKGQPYGPLPRAYPHPQLNIMAYFRYNLSRGFNYSKRISGE
jgi:protein TonB